MDSTIEKNILLVDDDALVLKSIRVLLEQQGYRVICAKSSAEARDKIKAERVNLIISDIRMPKVNGVEAINYFQQQYPRVPLIVLTGFPDMDMATGFLKQGIVDYLVKPVEKEKLINSVAKAMGQRDLNRL